MTSCSNLPSALSGKPPQSWANPNTGRGDLEPSSWAWCHLSVTEYFRKEAWALWTGLGGLWLLQLSSAGSGPTLKEAAKAQRILSTQPRAQHLGWHSASCYNSLLLSDLLPSLLLVTPSDIFLLVPAGWWALGPPGSLWPSGGHPPTSPGLGY